MRSRLVMFSLVLVAGCAAQPQSPPPAAVATPQATPETETIAATLEEVLHQGYDMVNENGKTLYCREQLKTGSHLRKETICMTAEELRAAREASRRNLEQMQRAVPPPQGN